MSDIFPELQACLDPTQIITDPQEKSPYETAWRGGWQGNALAVLFPESTQQVSKIVHICGKHHVHVVPQGGNTGLVGGSVPTENGPPQVILNLSRMRKILNVDADAFTLTAEAGCTLAQIQNAAGEMNRLFPLSMASEGTAQLGGFLSTNAGGIAVLRYGNARALTLGLEVVLADGQILDTLNTLPKDNTGYDLKQLFIGAEGTLGIITAAKLRLFPRPQQMETACCAVTTPEDAITLFTFLKEQLGDTLCACELMSAQAIRHVTHYMPDTRAPLTNSPAYTLLIETSLTLPGNALRAALETTLMQAYEQGLTTDVILAESLDHAAQFWHVRESISEAARQAGRGIHFDISVPLAAIAAMLTTTLSDIRKAIPEASPIPFGHMGDGNLHYNFLLPKDVDDAAYYAAKACMKKIIYDAVSTHHGSISAEHGVGQERRDDLPHQKSGVSYRLMKKIYACLNENTLLNPGKLLK